MKVKLATHYIFFFLSFPLSLSLSLSLPPSDGTPVEPPNIVPEAEILSVGADDEDNFENDDDLGEFSISRIINQHAAGLLPVAPH